MLVATQVAEKGLDISECDFDLMITFPVLSDLFNAVAEQGERSQGAS